MEGQLDKDVKLPSIKRKRKLPVVLSKQEMVKLLNTPLYHKHRILIALLYGCGLRCFEARNIKINDLDFYRSTLHVRQGKGSKDRYVPLGNFLVEELKNYLRFIKPSIWLFGSKETEKTGTQTAPHYSQTGVRWAVGAAAKNAGLIKKVNVHTLRHSFATHLLEDGLDIVSIKELLGHSRIETTLQYLHVAKVGRKLPYSPLDNLEGVKLFTGMQCKFDFLPRE
jgi:site-specific recombinase XerD